MNCILWACTCGQMLAKMAWLGLEHGHDMLIEAIRGGAFPEEQRVKLFSCGAPKFDQENKDKLFGEPARKISQQLLMSNVRFLRNNLL